MIFESFGDGQNEDHLVVLATELKAIPTICFCADQKCVHEQKRETKVKMNINRKIKSEIEIEK